MGILTGSHLLYPFALNPWFLSFSVSHCAASEPSLMLTLYSSEQMLRHTVSSSYIWRWGSGREIPCRSRYVYPAHHTSRSTLHVHVFVQEQASHERRSVSRFYSTLSTGRGNVPQPPHWQDADATPGICLWPTRECAALFVFSLFLLHTRRIHTLQKPLAIRTHRRHVATKRVRRI
jgi:hypothetical protein